MFAWSTLPFRRERAKEWSRRRRRHQNRGHDYSSYGYVLVWYGMVHHYNHKWSRRSKVISSWRNALRPVITFRYARNISRAIWAKKIEHAHSLFHTKAGVKCPKMGAYIKSVEVYVLLEILKLPNFTSRFLHYKNNSIKKFPKPMYGWMKCTSHKKHVKDRSIVGNTHTKVISIDESIIKWGRPCQMLSFLNKGAC